MSRLVSIGDVTSRVETWDPLSSMSNEPFHYIDISSVDRESKQVSATQLILPSDAPSRAKQIVKAGDILVSTVRPNLNTVAEIPERLNGATASTGYCVLRPDKEKIDSRFLFFWVRSSGFIKEMVKRATGASYPAVSDKIVKDSKLPLPPLPEQKRIAAILDKADSIRRKRQEAVRLTEELQRSVFLEMFGDPVANPKGWKEADLTDVAEIVSGVTKGRNFDSKQTVFAPYLRVANVQDGFLNLSEIKEIEVLPSDIAKYRLHDGDILLTEGGDPDKLGRGTVWREHVEDCIHQNHIFRVRVKTDNLLPDFLSVLIGSERGKRYFLRAAKQTTGIASINSTQLKNFPVLIPTIALQQRFANSVVCIKKLNMRLIETGTATDYLFNSILQRAFRGEL